MKKYAIIETKAFDKNLHKYWGYKSDVRHVRKSADGKQIIVGVYNNAQKNALQKKEIEIYDRKAIRKMMENF